MSTGQAADTVIASYINSPSNGQLSTTDGTVFMTSYSPLAYISRYFLYWRGSIHYRFKFVKTPYHSGRLLLSFEPVYVLKSAGSTTIETSQYLYRTIIDLREQNEVEISVPYIYPAPWQQCIYGTGTWKLIVLDALVAPAMVASTIGIIVEIKGGPDFRWAAPIQFNDVPIVPSAVQMDNVLSADTVGNVAFEQDALDVLETTQGEVICSFRQMIKRYSIPLCSNGLNAAAQQYTILPFSSFFYFSNGTTVVGSSSICTQDLYSGIGSLYAMSRGGVRIAFMPVGNGTAFQIFYALAHNGGGSGALTTFISSQATTFNDYLYNINCLGLSTTSTGRMTGGIFIPQNLSRFARMQGYEQTANAIGSLYSSDNVTDPSQLKISQQGSSQIPLVLLRAGADDASFGCFVSVPPHYTTTAP